MQNKIFFLTEKEISLFVMNSEISPCFLRNNYLPAADARKI